MIGVNPCKPLQILLQIWSLLVVNQSGMWKWLGCKVTKLHPSRTWWHGAGAGGWAAIFWNLKPKSPADKSWADGVHGNSFPQLASSSIQLLSQASKSLVLSDSFGYLLLIRNYLSPLIRLSTQNLELHSDSLVSLLQNLTHVRQTFLL